MVNRLACVSAALTVSALTAVPVGAAVATSSEAAVARTPKNAHTGQCLSHYVANEPVVGQACNGGAYQRWAVS